MPELTDLERRALAHLPRWRDPDERFATVIAEDENGDPTETQDLPLEEHLRITNRYPADWTLPRALRSTELAIKLTADPFTTDDGEQAIGPERVDDVLATLAASVVDDDVVVREPLCELTGDGWRMTQAGLEALTAPVEV